jgi:hypothetical protein
MRRGALDGTAVGIPIPPKFEHATGRAGLLPRVAGGAPQGDVTD